MPAQFNASGAGGFTPVVPSTSPVLSSAAVTTERHEDEAIVQTYRFPGLDGAGSTNFGRAVTRITWRLTFTAANSTNRLIFESLLASYLKAGRRFVLESEFGDTWSYCELRKITPQGPPLPLSGGGWFRELLVEFVDMQPG